jgi:cytoskeletal protein RodZ
MPSTPFGEHLKREREMRGVSLEEVAAATRISTRFLEAIENEQWDELPGGVFNRGFIRAIARFLGLDEDSLVAEYALETKGAVDVRAVPERPGEIPRNWRAPAVAILVLVLVVVLGWLAYHHYAATIAARFHRHATETSGRTRGMTFAGLLAGAGFERAAGGSH